MLAEVPRLLLIRTFNVLTFKRFNYFIDPPG